MGNIIHHHKHHKEKMGLEISQEKKEETGITVNEALYEFLSTTKVGNLTGEQEIIYTTTESSISSILEVMKENNLHSLPVREELLACDIGMISIMDIISYLHRVYVGNNKKEGFSQESIDLFFNSNASRVMVQSLTDPLLSQTYHSNNQLCWVVSPDTSLLHVMKEISRDFNSFDTFDKHPYVEENENDNNENENENNENENENNENNTEQISGAINHFDPDSSTKDIKSNWYLD
eukprot:TRINITY_DN501_c2_g2_i4.p1 TRINITY_DN501_c2_g2~~TRINITY_DN501_c2_g2_i4.p1  ORF type:complete len:235 (-),score=60.19 TRINITY_DN501_c2_g2_i4:109-813(-)